MAAAADLQAKIDALTTAEANVQTGIAGITTLANGLVAEIAALKNGTTDPAQLAAIDALTQKAQAQADALKALIVADTPPA